MAKWNEKFSKKLAQEIEEWISKYGLIDYDGATVKQLIEHFGINPNTYYAWKKKYPALLDAIEQGKNVYREQRTKKCVQQLFKAAEGGYVEEETETTEYVPARSRSNSNNEQSTPRIRKMVKTKTKKYIKPDVAANIFLLTNLDPEHYQNKFKTDVNIRKPKADEMSIEEINAELERLEKLEK